MSYSHRIHNFIMHYGVGFLAKIKILKHPDQTRESLRIQVENFKIELRRLLSNIPITITILVLFFFGLFSGTLDFAIISSHFHNQNKVIIIQSLSKNKLLRIINISVIILHITLRRIYMKNTKILAAIMISALSLSVISCKKEEKPTEITNVHLEIEEKIAWCIDGEMGPKGSVSISVQKQGISIFCKKHYKKT